MDSSIITTSIHSALDDLKLLDNKSSDSDLKNKFKILMHRLRNLRTFLLCARKLGNDVHLRPDDNSEKDGSLGFLLARIDDVVCKIQPYCLSLKDGFPLNVGEINNFLHDIESFDDEIDGWYITLSKYSWQSNSLTTDEVMETTDSVLETLASLFWFAQCWQRNF